MPDPALNRRVLPAVVPHVLVVEDDPDFRETLRDLLHDHGLAVLEAASGHEALALLDKQGLPDVAVVDLVMPIMGGLELLAELKRRSAGLPVFVMTGFATIETAVRAIREGAEDYLTKPIEPELVIRKLRRVVEVQALRREVALLREAERPPQNATGIIGRSAPMRDLLRQIEAAARVPMPVLVLGDTGTGKELVARAIHRLGPRAQEPFVAVNCAAVPGELVEGELFGHTRGAYTGATSDSPGVFRQADGGTIFLDELGEMPQHAQAKLLRVLEDGILRPVGGTEEVQVDVRVIAATNRPLETLCGGVLREDLYYRLAVIALRVPPMRERKEDIPLLADHFLRRAAQRHGCSAPALEPGALDRLMAWDFPGNVRELENILEQALVLLPPGAMTLGERELRAVPPFRDRRGSAIPEPAPGAGLSMAEVERFAIVQALRVAEGNKSRAAEILGISRDSLYRKIGLYEIPT